MTFKFIRVNGVGTISLIGGYRDVIVYGYFVHGHLDRWDKWSFIVHQDITDPNLVTVSEASTGRLLRFENYYSVEDALHFALPFVKEKHYYFATTIGNILTKTQTNLLHRNTTILQTLAIDTALWL